jgi:hypothetical protein
MNIGVFGDSYADKAYLDYSYPVIWYNFLQKKYGHTIECFAEGGSSIVFSARLIELHASKYDLVIWCLTIPGRFSFRQHGKTRSYHIASANDKCDSNDIGIIKKHQVCLDYLKWVFDWDQEMFVAKSIVSYIQNCFPNVMIIPCFPWPLESTFNLFDLAQQEADHYFPGKKLNKIFETYKDLSPGHITKSNQEILADLINHNLNPGIFKTSYDNFVVPTTPFDQAFKKL